MDNVTRLPIGFDDAIRKIAMEFVCTEDIDVVLEDLPENNIRILTIASLFDVSSSEVSQAIVEQIEYQLTLDPPDKELIDHLIREEKKEFQRTAN